MTYTLREKQQTITATLLDESRPAYSMRTEVLELRSILEATSGMSFNHENIAEGETRTDSGVAISPAMAAMCVDDFVRTIQFIRGLHEAICDVRESIVDRPVRVLYAGCGPFAVLAVPLMTLFAAEEVRFTLLDIHEESLRSARTVVEALELEDHVTDYVKADATVYEIDPSEEPDIIVIEMLRGALESEPQVAVTANLAGQAAFAVMIPERIKVELALVNSSREFSFENNEPDRDRINLGTVFTLNGQTLCGPVTVQVPEYDRSLYRPMLLTYVDVYQGHVLKDYDSGITCPKQIPVGAGIKPGSKIEFAYELGRSPHLGWKIV